MNVFLQWLASERIFSRAVCFKGPDPSDFNQPTAPEYAMAETAANEWNEFIKGKPAEEDYLEDISTDPAKTAAAVQGEAVTDLAVKNPLPVGNPGQGMNPAGVVRNATTRAKVMGDIAQDTTSQQAAGKKAYVENAMGIQATADTAQAGMAADAVKRNINDAEADYSSKAAGMRSFASVAGTGAGFLYDGMKQKAA